MSTKAGIPISVAVDRLRQKTQSTALKQLAERLINGEPVAESFENVGIFSPFECNLIRVGVQTARLEDIFTHLAEYGVGQFIFDLISHTMYVYSFCIPLSVLAIYTWGTEAGQRFWLAWPLIGNALCSTYVYRWITALRLEYSAGIGLPDAVSDAWKASGFIGSYALAGEAESSIREGNSLSSLIRRWPRLPRDWADFIESGEQAGTLETTLETLSEESSSRAREAQNRLRTWLPRIVFVILMMIVGYLMITALLAFMTPITNMFPH